MDLLSIGAFARLSGLTVRAVRHYGELGLVEPVAVDRETGYRRYSLDQVAEAAAIKRLRGLGISLDEIGRILEVDDESFTRARLIEYRAKVAERAAATEQILTVLQRLIEGEEELVPSVEDISGETEIKEVAAQPVLVIRERASVDGVSEVIYAALGEIAARLDELSLEPAGPPVLECPYPDENGLMDLEIACPVESAVGGTGRIDAATLPTCTVVSYRHHGHYEELDRSYRALEALVEREGLTRAGAPREIYWTNPNELPDPADWETEIQFPIVRDEARIAAFAGSGSL